MPFHKDFGFATEGNQVVFRKGASNRAFSLPPGQGITFSFPAIEGELKFRVKSVNFNKPTRFHVIGPHADPKEPDEGSGSLIEEFNHVPVAIDLIPPGQTKPIVTKKTEDGFSQVEEFVFSHVVGGATSKPGIWKCRVTNKGKVSANVDALVSFVFDREPLQTTVLPRQLIDHAYQVILEALMPNASVSGNTVSISFNSEIVDFFGNGAVSLEIPPHPLPFDIEGTGSMQSFTIAASSGKDLLEAMRKRWQSNKTEFEKGIARAQQTGGAGATAIVAVLQQSLKDNDEWREFYEARIQPDFAAIYVNASFTDIHLELDVNLRFVDFDIDIADIEDGTVEIYVAFDPRLIFGFSLILNSAKLTGGLLNLAEELGFIPPLNEIVEDILRGPLDKATPEIGRYLAEALARLSARDAVFMSLTADDNAWRVQHAPVPKEHFRQGTTVGGVPVTGDVTDVVLGPAGGVGSGGGTQPQQPKGEMPEEFIVNSPATLAKLDKVETIVVVMMENRSFDHMLGFLRSLRGPKYEGFLGSESNNVSERQPAAVRLRRASEVIPDPVTKIIGGPEHGTEHVKAQVADGAMSGFAQDYENRFPGKAENAMTFYTDKELKTYYPLAADYKVCDHWFASHPGPTWPNRWCTFGGTAFELRNLDINDRNIGFINKLTIFDLLDARGIDWRIFESDLSLIRTYDRYRLNNRNVLPLVNKLDQTQNFAEVAARGELPPVVFVEPNFSDLPPISGANDDLVPVDLRRGQAFVQSIYAALCKNRPKWNNTLLLITYDEHGGFYDHVPPPGTPLGPPEFIGKIPRIHPDGADHLGVRVPAILVSPLVNAGEVSKEVFDHTSIIKTILLRFRNSFTKDDFTKFGERVNRANHLGLALDRLTPRADKPKPIRRISLKKAKPEKVGATFRIASKPVKSDDFHEALRRAFLPRRGES